MPDKKSIRFPDAAVNLILGEDELALPVTEQQLKQELRDEGIDPDASWAKAKKLLDASAGRLKLETARRERLAATQTTSSFKAAANETRESLIEQIKRLLALEPAAAVYARKWEDGDLTALISLRDKLSSTSARARKNAS
ncbi:MAG: hypothetical protein WC661_17995 [Opitutaceae bacterium]|jgi:hypothetical protein